MNEIQTELVMQVVRLQPGRYATLPRLGFDRVVTQVADESVVIGLRGRFGLRVYHFVGSKEGDMLDEISRVEVDELYSVCVEGAQMQEIMIAGNIEDDLVAGLKLGLEQRGPISSYLDNLLGKDVVLGWRGGVDVREANTELGVYDWSGILDCRGRY